MSAQVPSVDDVHAALLERIGAGIIEVGSKLPSCRVLADELGSNPSTINRAIQRLSYHGLVRTEPRVGTFLINKGAAPDMGQDEVEKAIRDAVLGARRSGFDTSRIRETFEGVLALGSRGAGVVAFVECNSKDLERMSQFVENTTGVSLKPMLISELETGWEEEIDVVVCPMFHLADLMELSADLGRVVELNFIPSASVLRELSTLRLPSTIAVVAPTARGVERMKALVSQYYAGPILAPDLQAPSALEGVDVLVHPVAIEVEPGLLAGGLREIVIDWELDPGSAATFLSRIAAAVPK
jgi:DNA-binding transcriptional regulator YhcF (GntR family)